MTIMTGSGAADSLNGGADGDQISGLGGNDTLNGLAGDDTLNGGAGADSMSGGSGNDVYWVDDAGDKVTETNANPAVGGIDTVYSLLAAYTLGNHVEHVRLMSAGAANATGNDLANVLYAGDGNNVMDGGGNTDAASYQYAGGAVTVSLAIAGVQDTGGSGMDRLISIENLTGSAWADTLTGNAQANALNGGAGADTLSGGDGNDTYYVNSAADVVIESNADTLVGGVDLVASSAGNYALGANLENLRLDGGGNINGTGNAQANTIFAGAGNNVINGAGGKDTVSYAGAAGGVTVDLADNTMQDTGGSGFDTLKNLENLIGSNHDDVLAGTAGNNLIDGNHGIDRLDMSGAGAGVRINLTLTGPQQTQSMGVDTILNIEDVDGSEYDDVLVGSTAANLLDGKGGDDSVNGGGGADELFGGFGDDTLNGGGGADTMNGADGDDTFVVDSLLDVISGDDEGIDTVITSLASYTLGDISENLVITASGPTESTGNWRMNRLFATEDDNLLDGQGAEDTVDYSNGASSGVVINLATGTVTGGTGTDTLVSIEHATGSDFADTITGSTTYNILDGGAGADSMSGGSGGDVYYVDNAGDLVVEGVSAGYEQVHTTVSYTLAANCEELFIDGAGNVNGTGNTLGNRIYAGDGDNVMIGGGGYDTLRYDHAGAGVTISLAIAGAQATGGSGTDTVSGFYALYGSEYADHLSGDAGSNTLGGLGGVDTLAGGAGDDNYYVSSGDQVIENVGEGTDTLYAATDQDYTMGDNIEVGYVWTTSSIGLTGNGQDNDIYGSAGNNALDGGAGIDTAFVGYNATGGVTASLASGTSTGGAIGNDTLANFENLTGGNHWDSLTGNASANRLDGGRGNDTLAGGGGNDSFRFSTDLSVAGIDTITDFAVGADKISLENDWFAKLAQGALAGASFVNGTAAVDGNDYIIYDGSSGALYYDNDGNGVQAQVQFATLSTKPALSATDFVVT